MGKIKLLDDGLANKIAAGEVVERPSAVVKELVENAIDANSTIIEIFVESGGLKSIRILDNGDGILPDDVKTAFCRHATSKIYDERDLFKIMTLGFRGEALPSIASVSHITLQTSTGANMGVLLKLIGGKIISESGANCRKGTDITVSNIFFNTPARLKYLKSEATELGNILDVINRLALSNPKISFCFTSNGKTLLKTSGNGDVSQVFANIYGLNTAKKLLSIKATSLDYEMHGLISLPEITRASKNNMTIILNGRFIKNFLITKAIISGYHTLLPINRYPFALINVTLDPVLVDVNVHPAKMEVRLSKEPELMELITKTIKNKLNDQLLIPDARPALKIPKNAPVQTEFSLSNLPTSHVEEKPESKLTELKNKDIAKVENAISTKTAFCHKENTIENSDFDKADFVGENVSDFGTKTSSVTEIESDAKKAKPKLGQLFPVGQVHGTYIVAQNEEGMFLIDQHAAAERLNYEYYMGKLDEVNFTLQQLLIPITLQFSLDKVIKINEHIKELESVGVSLEPFGNNSFIVRATPTWFKRGSELEVIEALIEQVLETKHADIKKLREASAITLSCKSAVKANHYLTIDEMQILLDRICKSENPLTCPHGRPIVVRFSVRDLEKMFKRVMD